MRIELSQKYVYGTGLEIAAFHNPWPLVNKGVTVIYLDKLTNPELRRTFPEITKSIVDVHVIDDANYLKCIPDESMNFVLSSHVFEHMENPGVALKHWLRVLKTQGCLVMAIPLKHNYIDNGRQPTTFDHVVEEFIKPDSYDLESHYREYFSDSVDKLTGEKLEQAIAESLITKANIHFHCWDMIGLAKLFHSLDKLLDYTVCEFMEAGHEAFVVLKKI